MKIHMRLPFLPMPPAPPPTALATAIQLEMQAEELTKTAQQQQTRLKKLFGARKTAGTWMRTLIQKSTNKIIARTGTRSTSLLDIATAAKCSGRKDGFTKSSQIPLSSDRRLLQQNR